MKITIEIDDKDFLALIKHALLEQVQSENMKAYEEELARPPKEEDPPEEFTLTFCFKKREEAEGILIDMRALLIDKHFVSYTDLLRRLRGYSRPVHDLWGWQNLEAALVRQERSGWVLSFPAPVSLKGVQ